MARSYLVDEIFYTMQHPRNPHLQQLQAVCVQAGQVINKTKAEFQASLKVCHSPHHQRCQAISCIQVLVWPTQFKKFSHCISHVRDLFLWTCTTLGSLHSGALGLAFLSSECLIFLWSGHRLIMLPLYWYSLVKRCFISENYFRMKQWDYIGMSQNSKDRSPQGRFIIKPARHYQQNLSYSKPNAL